MLHPPGASNLPVLQTGVKERPEWLEKSTVYQQPEGAAPVMEDEAEATKPVRLKRSKDVSDTGVCFRPRTAKVCYISLTLCMK